MSDYLASLIDKSLSEDPGFSEVWDPYAHMLTLTRERVRQGLSQEEIATRMGLQRAAVSRMENHPDGVSFARILAYARVLKAQLVIQVGFEETAKRDGQRGRPVGGQRLKSA